MIDAKLGAGKEGYFHEKKISLLTKEDKIEEDFEKQVNILLLLQICSYLIIQAMVPVKPKKFKVALNTSFFDCARFIVT